MRRQASAVDRRRETPCRAGTDGPRAVEPGRAAPGRVNQAGSVENAGSYPVGARRRRGAPVTLGRLRSVLWAR